MDIFDFALKMERESEKYYREQAGKTDFLDLRILLEKLADTEAKHYEIVEALRSQNNDLLPEDWTLEETKNIFDSYIKDTEAMCKAISIKKDKAEQLDIYRLALIKEQESAAVYEKILTQTEDKNAQAVIKRLIKEEQAHAAVMDEIIDLLNKVSDWVESAEFNHTEAY